ncbi:hypothetical protein BDK51DRAFT_44797 [Blyttiomyces helicus]|uniref:Uncharacterized protein n=1 Tax=Blyttiomyces helicus TaxID=388810 RepID=A0A4P9WNH6_9FUNG|nr:hypothetical protein BDK51DRAFT_44797 [Blyttiomyces helicus]|eukprot:RKO93248.1 hypothetical protein BDK51DRAFT_44797 [Blyttiomyces helicus]
MKAIRTTDDFDEVLTCWDDDEELDDLLDVRRLSSSAPHEKRHQPPQSSLLATLWKSITAKTRPANAVASFPPAFLPPLTPLPPPPPPTDIVRPPLPDPTQRRSWAGSGVEAQRRRVTSSLPPVVAHPREVYQPVMGANPASPPPAPPRIRSSRASSSRDRDPVPHSRPADAPPIRRDWFAGLWPFSRRRAASLPAPAVPAPAPPPPPTLEATLATLSRSPSLIASPGPCTECEGTQFTRDGRACERCDPEARRRSIEERRSEELSRNAPTPVEVSQPAPQRGSRAARILHLDRLRRRNRKSTLPPLQDSIARRGSVEVHPDVDLELLAVAPPPPPLVEKNRLFATLKRGFWRLFGRRTAPSEPAAPPPTTTTSRRTSASRRLTPTPSQSSILNPLIAASLKRTQLATGAAVSPLDPGRASEWARPVASPPSMTVRSASPRQPTPLPRAPSMKQQQRPASDLIASEQLLALYRDMISGVGIDEIAARCGSYDDGRKASRVSA